MPFLIALAAAVALTPVAGRLGLAVGLVDRPGGALKIHTRAIPVLGGLAVVSAVLASLALTGGFRPAVAGAIGLLFIAGLLDDRRPLPPWTRILAQLAAAAALLADGVRVQLLGALGGAAMVVLVLGCTNAVNLIDGQDGLAAGLVALAALGLAALTVDQGAERLGLALAGALVGFLVWNRPPARIFLGDAGAYAAGAALAVLAAEAANGNGWAGLLASGLCLGVLAFELAFTVVRRVLTRASLTGGDRWHSYDLLAAQVGRVRSMVGLWAVGAAVAGVALVVAMLPVVAGLAVVLAVCGVGAVLGRRLWTLRQTATPDLPSVE
ncbi:MAG TPA: hypothetical protein VG411_08960 [Actinomycetota bacterium]|nr:hypothetical protein [Actinomycetota bacterium]